jgi:hypothetical protein
MNGKVERDFYSFSSRLVLAIFFDIYTVPYEWNGEMQFQQTQHSDYALNKLNDPAFNYSGLLFIERFMGKHELKTVEGFL